MKSSNLFLDVFKIPWESKSMSINYGSKDFMFYSDVTQYNKKITVEKVGFSEFLLLFHNPEDSKQLLYKDELQQ